MTTATEIKLRCPSCGRAVAPAPLLRHATDVRVRTCRGCSTRWQVKLEPLCGGPGYVAHLATWIALGD